MFFFFWGGEATRGPNFENYPDYGQVPTIHPNPILNIKALLRIMLPAPGSHL